MHSPYTIRSARTARTGMTAPRQRATLLASAATLCLAAAALPAHVGTGSGLPFPVSFSRRDDAADL